MLLNLNLIRFSFKHLLISEVFIRTLCERDRAAAFGAKDLASIAFSGCTFPSEDVSSPLRMDAEGSGASLPLRPEQQEETSHWR